MLNKLICWLKGHKRGKREGEVMRCPRCKTIKGGSRSYSKAR